MKPEQCSHLIDYFNGTLNGEEAADFEGHLHQCSECREELEELRMLTEDLPYLSEPEEPDPEMRNRILDAAYGTDQANSTSPVSFKAPEVKKTRRRQPLLVSGLAATLILSLAGNFLQLSNNQEEIVQSGSLQKQVALASPEGNEPVRASASFMKDQNSRFMVLQADGLPEISEGELYQVWLIKGEKPVPAGYFTPDGSGSGALLYKLDQKNPDWDTVAVTVEKEPNLEAPRGNIILAGNL
ncbi:hypothetical protein GKZ89_20000 [Bacillus mangrovi]|uniref:Anti-sigma-W factor RsiW n=1 Tax=Metabacillus mangrovi TaxID=1491830 RepID=A0A7X2S8M7_9BACI|nr:anti-sigma factor [Metabacillus mangrovi]MTH55682.1 hypothetical protein [Metabacillus mangrovi]